MFQDGYYQMGKALYQSKINYVNSAFFQSLLPFWDWWFTEEKLITTYNLLGDPTVDIYTALNLKHIPIVIQFECDV